MSEEYVCPYIEIDEGHISCKRISDLEAKLEKAVGALRAIVKLSEDGDVYDMCSNAECKMRDVAEKTIKELEGA